MITFKTLREQTSTGVHQFPWNPNPKIGWWMDNDPLVAYHGTNIDHLDSIAKTGLDRLDPNTGMISFAYEPFTARAFAVMGGEARFLKARGKAKSLIVPENKRIVLVFHLPKSFVQQYYDKDMHGNNDQMKDRLRSKSLYDEWNGTDQQYYQLAEIRIKSKIPAKYLKGYMIK